MVHFNFESFMVEKRVTFKELAQNLGVTPEGIQKMKNRSTIKISFLRKLESIYGDCSQYLKTERAQAV